MINNTAKINLSIGSLVKWLSAGKKIHICIHYLSGAFQNEKAFDVPPKNEIHYCTFCNAAKTTTKGLSLCLKNKSLSIKRAINDKETYIGQCYLGITEIVKPVFFDGKPFCIIYLGNLIIDERMEEIKRKISKAANISGIDEKLLIESLGTAERVSQRAIEEYTEIVEIISSCIELSILNCIKNLDKEECLETTESKHWVVKQALNYIDQYYYTDIRLCHISDLFFINEQYLCRLFSKQVGMGFSEYLNRVRIDNAKRMLSETRDKITDISTMVGFNNITYFNSTFKRYTNLTPGQYRRNT